MFVILEVYFEILGQLMGFYHRNDILHFNKMTLSNDLLDSEYYISPSLVLLRHHYCLQRDMRKLVKHLAEMDALLKHHKN